MHAGTRTVLHSQRCRTILFATLSTYGAALQPEIKCPRRAVFARHSRFAAPQLPENTMNFICVTSPAAGFYRKDATNKHLYIEGELGFHEGKRVQCFLNPDTQFHVIDSAIPYSARAGGYADD